MYAYSIIGLNDCKNMPSYGFRNIQNMMDMVHLVCSDIRIPLPNRKSNVPNVA